MNDQSAHQSLSDSGNERIKPGGNMTPLEVISEKIDDLYQEAANWADGSPIESQEQCDALDKLDKELLALNKEREALRKEEVKPLDEAKKEIQALHKPIEAKVKRARDALNAPRAKWKAKLEEEKRKRAEEAAREAEGKRAEAVKAMQSSSGDLKAREEAEELLKQSKLAEKDAKKANKAATTGTGLRTVYVAEMTDERAAIASMWQREPQAFIDLAQDLANKAVRSGERSIDGFKITETKKAV